MEKTKQKDLNQVYQGFINTCMGVQDLEGLAHLVDENIFGFGSALDEKIQGIEAVKKLLQNQIDQSKGSQITWMVEPFSRFISQDENTAVLAENIQMTMHTGEEQVVMHLRLSIVLNFVDTQWKVIHWHVSKPEEVESEKDTWGIENWRQKAEEMERLVAEKTADLVEKNLELEIEAALERVRSTSLAMHSSQDLSKVVYVVFTELVKLDAQLDRCLILIVNSDTSGITWYLTGKEGLLSNNGFLVEDNPHPSHQAYLEGWRTKRKKWHYLLAGEEKKSCDEYLFSQTELAQLPDFIKADMAAVGSIHLTISSDDFGCLIASSLSPLSNAHAGIVERFSIVFNQAYTRFLDLQKAEAQAREAQIEAALERVRSRSMAMHQSEELREVIQLMFEQFRLLNFTIDSAQFDPNYKETNDLNLWAAVPGQPYSILLHIPYADNVLFNSLNEAKKRGLSFITQHLSLEEKNQFFRHFFQHINDIPVERQKLIFDGPGMYRAVVFMENVSLAIQNYSNTPYTEEENDVLKRFGKTFEQVYTRFLDLEKAEAQAREAQIEAALERVRSQSMGMQTSKDLSNVTTAMFEQLRMLGGELYATGIVFCDKHEHHVEQWHSVPEAGMLSPFIVPVDLDYIHQYRYDQWKIGVELFSIEIPEDFIAQHFEAIFNLPTAKTVLDDFAAKNIPMPETPSWEIDYGASFKHGYILASALQPFGGVTILPRFAKVFEQTYTRFLDLQKAEAQAREAQIEAALEKVRSRSLAMQKPEELVEVAELLRGEMGQLGVEELETSSIYLVDSENKQAECWYAIRDIRDGNKSLVSDEMTLLLPATWVGGEMWKFFQSKKEQTSIAMKGDNRKEWINYCADRSQVLQGYYGNEIPERTYHLVKFTGGYMGAASPGEISTASWDLLKRAAAVFSFAYTRFKDLQDAEARAREAQIELAMEKVRGRTMAMQSSEELADAAYVLFEQLNFLGVTHERINIGIVNEENQTIDFWITEQGGNKLSTKFSGRISEPTTLAKAYSAWKQGEKSLVVDLQGDELKSWLNYLNNEIKIPFNQAFLHERRVQTAGFFSKGMLIVTSPEPLQEEALYLLEKFAGVFDLTYTRFNDLKVAEAHALQAERDLIEIKLARQKAEDALTELKSTQTQLIQQEKLASLGQLTAGIAHEIKNPLNFVNNFSEVSMEMIDEILDSRQKTQESRPKTEADELEEEILEDIKANLEKIHEHGSRANGIVTSMLQHSRASSGKKEPTDLNALIKEYVNLSFHGMRAGKNPINVEIVLELDPEVKEVALIKEDFTRVIINLCNNAFDAMRGKKYEVPSTKYEDGSSLGRSYSPKLRASTILKNGQIKISFEDNGPGIPDDIKEKILQPFFTTKKGTEGTGLGLSITHDIVKAHGGELNVESKEGEGTCFSILLPIHS